MQAKPEDRQSPIANSMDNASLDFGGGAGVFNLNLSLPQGSILGMIGPRGCFVIVVPQGIGQVLKRQEAISRRHDLSLLLPALFQQQL